MRAAVVTAPGKIEVREIPDARLEQDNDILIKVESAAICNTTDYKSYVAEEPSQVWPNQPHPFVIGHECSGVVTDAARNADSRLVGKRVVFWTTPGGGFAEYIRADTSQIAIGVVDDTIPPSIAPVMEMVIGSARYLFSADGTPAIGPDSNVVVFGLGPAGLIYVQLAAAMGAANVAAVGHHDYRVLKACDVGANIGINGRSQNAVEKIKSELSHIDVVVDASGADIFEDIAQLCGRSAMSTMVVPYGVAPFDWTSKRRILEERGAGLADGSLDETKAAVAPCISWVSKGVIDLNALVSHTIPLERISEGLEMCRDRRNSVLKVIVTM